MAKEVYYNENRGDYYVRKKGTKNLGKFWTECPYPETAKKIINNLATSYTNALNSAEWIAEGEAKQAFLSASDIIVTFFASKGASKESLFGDLSNMKDEYKGLITGSPFIMFNYLSEHIPESLGGDFIKEVEAKESDSESTKSLEELVKTYHRVKKVENTYKLYSTAKDLVKLKKGMNLEKQLAEKVKEVGKLDNNKKIKDLSKKLEEQIGKDDNTINKFKDKAAKKGQEFISEYFAIWAPAVVTVMYNPKYNGIDWDELTEKNPVKAKRLKGEIKERIIFEARCNMFAAKIMGWLSSLGILLLKLGMTCTNILDKVLYGILGLLIVHSAQSISNGVKAAYGEYLKENKKENVDISWKKIISLGLEVMKDNLLDLQKYVGASRMYFTFPYQTKGYNPEQDINYIIIEKEIDAPGVFAGMKAFLTEDSLNSLAVQLDNTTLLSSKNLDAISSTVTDKSISLDYSKVLKQSFEVSAKLEIKNGSTTYIGVVEQIGNFYQEQMEEEQDIEFVAFYNFKEQGNEKMGEILDKIFNENPTKVSTNVLEYESDDERIVRRLKPKIQNIILPTKGKRLNKYLDNLDKHFGEDYAKNIIQEETIIVVANKNDMTPSVYAVESIEVIDKEAKKIDLDLNKLNISYKRVLNDLNNMRFINNDWVGSTLAKKKDYNYIIFSKDILSRDPLKIIQGREYNFFHPAIDLIIGSGKFNNNKKVKNKSKKESSSSIPKEESIDIKLWTGLGLVNRVKEPSKQEEIKARRIYINDKQIGSKLERVFVREGIFDYLFGIQEYAENIELDNDKVLEVRYKYRSNNIFKQYANLSIKYRCKHNKEDEWHYTEWNKLLIQKFADLDYGIDIPDKGEIVPGTDSGNEFKLEDIKAEAIEVDEVKSKGRGKIKINGQYLKAEGLKVIEPEIKIEKVYKVRKGDTLWKIAKDFLGQGSRWQELKKEDGSFYTKKEAKKLQVGTKVLIPKEIRNKYLERCKNCKYPSIEEVTNYIYKKMKKNQLSEDAKYIRSKLRLLKDRKWKEITDINNFIEVGKGYYRWYELVKNDGNWDYKGELKKNYKEQTCELGSEMLYGYQIWSNIHYGYIGRSLGLTKEELLAGASVVTARKGLDNVKDDYWRKKFKEIGDANFHVNLDDANEQKSIEIGFEIWKNYGLNVKEESIFNIIYKQESNLNKKTCSR